METIIADALARAGIGYSRGIGGENPSGLDFRLDNGVEIEVKRFHSPRIAGQMARADNVIAAQGEQAVRFLAQMIDGWAENQAAVKYAWDEEDFIGEPPAVARLKP